MVSFPTPNEDGSCLFSAEQMSRLRDSLSFLMADPKGAFIAGFAKTTRTADASVRLNEMGKFLTQGYDGMRTTMLDWSVNLAFTYQHTWYHASLREAACNTFSDEETYLSHWRFVAKQFKDAINGGNLQQAALCLLVLSTLVNNHQQMFNVGRIVVDSVNVEPVTAAPEDQPAMPVPVEVATGVASATGVSSAIFGATTVLEPPTMTTSTVFPAQPVPYMATVIDELVPVPEEAPQPAEDV